MTQDARPDAERVAGVVLPVGGANLLLPISAVAEIMTYRPPISVEDAPEWLLGILDWREHIIPAISISAAQEAGAKTTPSRHACLVVCFTLGGDEGVPHVALLATAAPRLVDVHARDLEPAQAESTNPFVLHALTYADHPAWIPNMDAIEDALLKIPLPTASD